MHQFICRLLLMVFGFALASASAAHAQNPSIVEISVGNSTDWGHAEQLTPLKSKLYVVTNDQPGRKQSCRVQSITDNELVCSHAHAAQRTYKREQIAALITPGTVGETLAFFFGFNAGLGASIWGTVALVAACPLCAAGTAFAALIFFGCAGVTLIADDASEPDRPIYIAPGQQFTGKLSHIAR